MKDRLLEFLRTENKSSAQLAEEIGVQPSGISHILSGRNNPSLDFVLKMLEKYQFLSSEWLLFGKGEMYKEAKMHSLFEDESVPGTGKETKITNQEQEKPRFEFHEDATQATGSKVSSADKSGSSAISRVIMFFNDNSFEEYTPRD
jgi:transcriptional regulator with XRE-family HTH domain